VVEREGHWRERRRLEQERQGGHRRERRCRSGTGRSVGVRGWYCQYDPMALDGDDAVRDLGQGFNVDVGAAIDLPDCRSGTLPFTTRILFLLGVLCAKRTPASAKINPIGKKNRELPCLFIMRDSPVFPPGLPKQATLYIDAVFIEGWTGGGRGRN